MHVKSIHFERTGGFAGIRLAADVDVDDLPDDQKIKVIELLDEMDFDELSGRIGNKAAIPDEFVYSVTVKTEKDDYNVITGESGLPDKMQPLIEILERIAKKQARDR